MNEQAAVVIGATGLTGSLLVEELLKDKSFKTVRILVRRPAGIIHPKLIQEIVNFNDIDDYTGKFGYGDVIFCCIGTTRKKVKGDKEAYIKIDFDIPINAARMGIVNKFKKFLIVSAIGANEKSGNFYLRLKGQTEKALQQFSFDSISIFRPSLLAGKRKEYRLSEKIAEGLMEIFSFVFFGYLRKYHAVNAITVAKAMVRQSKNNQPGVHYFEYEEIMDLARN